MGVIYHVACKQCKVTRNLDKFYTTIGNPQDRDEALEFCKRIEGDSFRAGLLVSFMGAHMGHECVLIDDQSWSLEGDEYEDYIEEDHFWDSHTFGGSHDRDP